jgi:hypothetical protein
VVSSKFSSPATGELPIDGRHASSIVCGQAPGDREAPARRSARRLRAATDRLQAPAATSAIAAMPACRAAPSVRPRSHPQPCGLQLLRRRRGRVAQRDQRAPVQAEIVGLASEADDPGRLQVSQPAPHIGGVRAQPPPAARIVTRRHRAPAHDRREPIDELPDRARIVPRALGVPPAPQQPLDCIRTRLETIVATRATAPRAARGCRTRWSAAARAPAAARRAARDARRARAPPRRQRMRRCWRPAAPPAPATCEHAAANTRPPGQALAARQDNRAPACRSTDTVTPSSARTRAKHRAFVHRFGLQLACRSATMRELRVGGPGRGSWLQQDTERPGVQPRSFSFRLSW